MNRNRLLSLLSTSALTLCLGANCSAQSLDALQVLPETTVGYVEIQPSEKWIKHPLRKQIEKSEPYREIWKTPPMVKARGGITLAELALGDRLESIVQKVAAKGVVVAIDSKTEGVVAIARTESKEWLAEYLDKLLNLVRSDAKNKSQPDPIKSAEYRSIKGYEIQKGIFATIDDTLIVTNKSELIKEIIDRYSDKASGGLGSKDSFKKQRSQAQTTNSSIAWGYLDVNAIRDLGVGKELFEGRAKDFNAELILGGLLSTFQHTSTISASLLAEDHRLSVRFRSPHEAAWVEEKREFFFGPDGKGDALPLIEVKDTIGSLSAYRDISKLWLMAGDLFDQQVNDQLAQADNTLTTLFSGKDFGSDILGALEPQMRIVSALQELKEGEPIPAIRLPSFALVTKLKNPKGMRPELKRIFQSLIGFLNVAGAQNGQPQLDMDMETMGETQLIMARYVAEVDRKEGKAVPIQFNFSPCLAFIKDTAILSSTETFAKQIAEQLSSPSASKGNEAKAHSNTLLELDAAAIRKALELNKSHLISQNMLEKGHSKKEAEDEIEMLMKILGLFRKGNLSLEYSDQAVLDVSLDLVEK